MDIVSVFQLLYSFSKYMYIIHKDNQFQIHHRSCAVPQVGALGAVKAMVNAADFFVA